VDGEVSFQELEDESVVALPNKEVLSLLDVTANANLGLDLAAPVDLAAAADLNVAAPIEAAATANVLSPGAEAVGLADQQGVIEQGLSGHATATAPQHAQVDQNSSTSGTTGTTGGAGSAGTTGTSSGTSGGVDSLLNGGSLLDANVNIDANANVAAPIDGAVAANANVAAPVDAAVGANVASPDAVAEAVAPQHVDVVQNLDANATATADQTAAATEQ
jgi:hypothetical protein